MPIFPCYLSPSSKRSRVTSPASAELGASSALRTPHCRPQLSSLYNSRLHSLQLCPSIIPTGPSSPAHSIETYSQARASCAGLLSPLQRAEISILSHVHFLMTMLFHHHSEVGHGQHFPKRTLRVFIQYPASGVSHTKTLFGSW